MGFTLIGLLLLSIAPSFAILLIGSALVGLGSSVFHPESSRVARMASGGQHGLAQSVFQVGGNAGSAVGPLAAAFVVLPRGQRSVAWFSLAALLAIVVLWRVGGWYGRRRASAAGAAAVRGPTRAPVPGRSGVVIASAFSAILVYAQELLPGRVGMISGLFFGLAFGVAGIGAAVLGRLADTTSIEYVYHLCSYLPALGLLTGFLPDLEA